ncbi:hypothetical protein PR048_012464 [Dryococelus australis]|uniref:Uncharacterized protein n=1 Tax=Dryococelus australis TaxID=614101 RepID=A0ABQ9HQ21_9NEOP|nr:hypothetical protein PR048_012464 [Dryococelus australis]
MAGSFTEEETCNRNVAKHMVDNYFSWALKVKQELLSKDVREVVIGYEETPGFLCNDGGLVNGAMNLKQLTHFVKPKDMRVQEYFAQINQLLKKTTRAGYEFTEHQVAGMIIGNLTEEFAVCVPALEAEVTKMSLSKVKTRLLT